MKVFENSLVYFVQGEITKLVKIGKTSGGIEDRVSTLQTGSPDKLSVIGIGFEPYITESGLHCLFDEFRQHGEWFLPAKEIIEYVENNCFKTIWSAYHAYYEVHAKRISYEEALFLTESQLFKLANQRLKI